MEELTAQVPAPTPKRWSVRYRLTSATLRTRLNGLFALGTLLVVILVGVNAVAFTSLVGSRHTLLNNVDPANLQADQLFLAYLNEETAVRGYVLSGNLVFLQPYDLGRVQAQESASRLNRLLSGQKALLGLAHRAESQARGWLDGFAKPAIAAVAGHKSTVDSSQAALLRGKTLFDDVRGRFADLDSALAASRASAQRGLASATVALIWTLAAALFVVVLAGILLSRALRLWVTDPLASIGSDSRAVADGDTAHSIAPSGPPDLRRHAEDLEAMRERIVTELQAAETARGELAVVNGELTRSNTELEQFAYVASHDLQEPLRKVTSFVQLLQQRYEGQLDERADQYIEFAVDGAKRMQVLINDLLAFSRVGRTTERFADIELGAALSGALANLNDVIEETRAEVIRGPMPLVRGDESLLVSLWQNLVGNAIKFRSDKPPIVTIDVVRSGDEWVCSVSDNGLGIEPRFAEKIFVIFQRLHSRESYSGTGIGLALSKKIVEFHGGRIWLDDNHHAGTRMCFTLPVRDLEVSDEYGE